MWRDHPIIDRSAGALEHVATTYALTPAETRVLMRILSGKNVREAARDLSVAASTVRTHLDNIFLKTGVSRQTHLIRLVADIPQALT